MMKKIDWKTCLTTTILTLLPCLLGVIFYQDVPARVAVHFNINNQPNNFASKSFAFFGLPFLLSCLQFFLCVMMDFKKEADYTPKIEHISKWCIPLINLMVYITLLLTALGKHLNVQLITLTFIGVLFILIGNYLPKTRSTYSSNSITRYRFQQPVYQKKLNRFLGYTFVVFGALLLLAAFLPGIFSLFVMLALVIVVLSLTFHFYRLDKKHMPL